MKIIYFYLLLFYIYGCNSNEVSTTVIYGQKFDNPKAEELNHFAIEKAKAGQNDMALNIFFDALKLEPNNPTILSNIGLTYEVLDKNEQAIEFHEKSLIISDSTYLISGSNLGRLYCHIGEYSKGILILDFVIKNCKDEELLTTAYINRAFNYLGIEDCEKAQSDINFAKNSNLKSEELETQIERLEERIENCVQQ